MGDVSSLENLVSIVPLRHWWKGLQHFSDSIALVYIQQVYVRAKWLTPQTRAVLHTNHLGGNFSPQSGQFSPNAPRTIFIVVSNSILPDCMICRRLHITGTHSVLGVYSSHAWTNRTAVQSLSTNRCDKDYMKTLWTASSFISFISVPV